MRKEYESPAIFIEEYELESDMGNLCSGVGDIPYTGGGIE